MRDRALGTRRRLRRRSGISPLYDVKKTASELLAAEMLLSCMDGNWCWWSQTGSNRRPQACKASALPTELWPRELWSWSKRCTTARRRPNTSGPSRACGPPARHEHVVGLGRFELPTSRLSSARSNQLSYRPKAQASMRRKRNVGGGVPLVVSSESRAEARLPHVQVRARTSQ